MKLQLPGNLVGPQDLRLPAENYCMILRLLSKIGFKALLPVVAVAGLGSYMIHMNGGDPASTAKELVSKVQSGGQTTTGGLGGGANSNPAPGIVENIGSSVGATISQARQSVARAAAVVTRDEQPAATADGLRTVYRWVDSSGGTQFGTHPTADAREIEAIGLRRGGSGAPTTAAALPRAEGYPLGKSHSDLLQHISVPD